MKKPIRAPFGRMQEHVNKLSGEDKERAAIKSGAKLGDDDTLQVFPSREFMARMIRQEERSSPVSKWRPLVKLLDNEGY